MRTRLSNLALGTTLLLLGASAAACSGSSDLGEDEGAFGSGAQIREGSLRRYDTKYRASEPKTLGDGSLAMKADDENSQHAFSAHDATGANTSSTLLLYGPAGSLETLRTPFAYSKHTPGPKGTAIVRAVRGDVDELYEVSRGRPPVFIGASASVAELAQDPEAGPVDHTRLLLEAATAPDGSVFWINHENKKPVLHRFAEGKNKSLPLSSEPYPTGTCMRRLFAAKDRLLATCQGVGATNQLAQKNDAVNVYDFTGRNLFSAPLGLGIGTYVVDVKGRLLVGVGSLQRWRVTRFDPHAFDPNKVEVLSGGSFLKSRSSTLGALTPVPSGGFMLGGSVEESFGGSRAAVVLLRENGSPDPSFDGDGAASFKVDPPQVASISFSADGGAAHLVTFDGDSEGASFDLR